MPDTNCRNCGAPIKENRCEYCGTEYHAEKEGYVHITADSIKIGVLVADRMGRRERCAVYE